MSRPADIGELLTAAPVLPIVTIESIESAVDLARALARAGLGAMEVTLRTRAALAAIEAITRALPDMAVGAGTVLTRDDMRRAADSGAAFAVSPGATPDLLAAGREGVLPYLPGIATAGEIQRGIDAGYRYFKFFPAAGAGGIATLKAFAGPFPELRFCATGGVTAESAQAYLDLPNVVSVGGSWIAPAELVARRDWGGVEARTREAMQRFARR